MADNVPITAGAGTDIATDDIGSVHYQKIKLDAGGDGASVPVIAGQQTMAASVPVVIASNQSAVPVSLASVPSHAVTNAGTFAVQATVTASENVIGLVGSSDIVVTVTPTVDTSAYASGDLLFDSVEVANAVRANGGHAILQSVTIIDKADQGVAFTLLIANAATDFGTLNSAPDADDTECATIVGLVRIATGDYLDLGVAKVATVSNLGLLCKAGAATTSLYVAGVNSTGTPTYGAASDLVLQLGFLRS